MIDFKKRFCFGDKVIDRINGKRLIVFRKTRGDKHIVIDKKGFFWETSTGRLIATNWQEEVR